MKQEDKNKNRVEIWGGAECSVVRVGNSVYDQLSRSGHEERSGDPDLFAEAGIRTIRYPLLWEKHANNEKSFFELHDSRLRNLLELGITPIAGLLHHGSGPFFTDLMDKAFPELLAAYALKIAERYPWIENYTPVNEPLTTARFSGLYGLWYPHKTDDRAFARIFINELKGTVLAVKAVRSVNPRAGLVQTEDICRIYSTGTLKYQADFENQRRWMTYDLLTGQVAPGHPMWKYLTGLGIGADELDFFLGNPVAPSVCGFNYYVTSDRYLDQRKNLYPPFMQGGNGIHEYADVEAVRANIPVNIGAKDHLREAWERYYLPVALTEVHLACTREEQLRWFYEAWKNASSLTDEGIDVRAITAWSFFGSFDWSSLLCRKNNDYEPGVYDIRSGKPRPTAIAAMIRSINNGIDPSGTLLETPGWWRRTDRYIFRREEEHLYLVKDPAATNKEVQPLLITGGKGSLGTALAKICEHRGITYHLSGRDELDIASEESVRRLLEKLKPWAIINAAGFTGIDEAENEAFRCFRENTTGPAVLAELSKVLNIRFVTFSTDQVFNGRKKKPYHVSDRTEPLNTYGLSKKLAEEKVVRINPGALIIRSSFFFNPWNTADNLGSIIKSGLLSDRHFYLPADIVLSPAYIPDIVNTVLDLLIDGESGIRHLSSQEEISWFDFVHRALQIAGINGKIISPVPSSSMKFNAMRPDYSVLRSSCGITLPASDSALNSYITEFYKELELQTADQSLL